MSCCKVFWQCGGEGKCGQTSKSLHIIKVMKDSVKDNKKKKRNIECCHADTHHFSPQMPHALSIQHIYVTCHSSKSRSASGERVLFSLSNKNSYKSQKENIVRHTLISESRGWSISGIKVRFWYSTMSFKTILK